MPSPANCYVFTNSMGKPRAPGSSLRSEDYGEKKAVQCPRKQDRAGALIKPETVEDVNLCARLKLLVSEIFEGQANAEIRCP